MISFKELYIESLIAKGGFATVYEGKYKEQRVAIKQINFLALFNLMSYQETAKSLIKEISIMTTIYSENTVNLIGVSYDEDFCIITEMCQTTLESAILERTYNKFEVFQLILGAAKGLSHLHF